MQKIKPEGSMLIVFPLPKEEKETDAGIITQDFELTKAEVLEVSDEWSDRISRGDIVLFPDSDGTGHSIHYQKKACLWINAKSFSDGGDLWGILTETDNK